MPIYAVGHADFNDYNLTVEIISAPDPISAIFSHSKCRWVEDPQYEPGPRPTTIEDTKEFFCSSCDTVVGVTEVKFDD